MKKIPESQFNSLTNKRMNTIGGTMKDIVKTAENNPEHLTEEKVEAMRVFLNGAVENVLGALEAIMEQPTYDEIGEFKLPGGSASSSTGSTRKKSVRGEKARKLRDELIAIKKDGHPIEPESYDLLPKAMQKEVDAVEVPTADDVIKTETKPAPAEAKKVAEPEPEAEPEIDDADVEAAAIDAEDEETTPAEPESSDDSAEDDFSDDDLEALLSGDDLDDAA